MRKRDGSVAAAFRYFEAAARAGSMRAAARELNIASSAVNRQILMLEDMLSTRLFERAGRGLKLTAPGAILLAHVRQSQRGFEDAISAIDALHGLKRGRVRIATVESISVDFLPQLLTRFRKAYPGIRAGTVVTGSDAVTALARRGEVDLGFTFNPSSLEGLDAAYRRALKIGALMAPGHELAGCKTLTLARCTRYPFSLPARGLSVRAALDGALQKITPRAHPVIEANSLRMLASLAGSGECIAFQPRAGIERHLRAGTLVFVPLSDAEIAPDNLMLVRQSARQPSPAARAFFEMAVALLADKQIN